VDLEILNTQSATLKEQKAKIKMQNATEKFKKLSILALWLVILISLCLNFCLV